MPVHAQTAGSGDGQTAQPQEQAAPYDGELERLSEILGSVHYLRALCGAEEGQKWRARMQALIDAEDPSIRRRARMVNAFNRGYRGFQRTHSECTENSRLLIDRFMREASQISSLIATRYGN
ncbi:MAG: TIGR02301 family protein [Pseudomonadota bacterium]